MSTASPALESPFLTRAEAVAYSRLSWQFLRRAELEGRITPLRPSRRKLLYRRSEIEALLTGGPPPVDPERRNR
jgi:hypothetical protein